MNFFQHPYYRIINMFMTVTGQWSNMSFFHDAFVVMFGWVVVIAMFIPQILAAMKNHGEPVIVLQCVIGIIFSIMLSAKCLCLKFKMGKVNKLLNLIRVNWQIWTWQQEINIIHDYAEKGRKYMVRWVVLFSVITVVYSIQPAVPKIVDILRNNGSKPGLFAVPVYYYYFDEQEYYFYTIGHMFVTVSVGIVFLLLHDCIIIVSVQHGCGLFAALGKKLSDIGKHRKSANAGGKVCTLENDNIDLANLYWCIERHRDAMEYADLIESTFSWNFLMTLGLNIFIISISGYQIVTSSAGLQENARFVVPAVSLSVNMWLQCDMAQVLMDHSISIRHSLNSSNWYNTSMEVQKILYFMMIRSEVYCELTAGRTVVMCLESFLAMMKTSLSFLTVLRSM